MCTATDNGVADPAPPTSGAGHATAPNAVTAWALTGGGPAVEVGVPEVGMPEGGGAADGAGVVGGISAGAVVAGGEPATVADARAAALPELLGVQPANPTVINMVTPTVAVRTGFIRGSPRAIVIVCRRHRSQNEPKLSATRILSSGSGLFQARFASYDPKGGG